MPRLIYRDSDGIDRTIDVGADPLLIGRASECQVQTQDALVSRRHARLAWDGGSYVIEDLGSSNGVWIAGERVQKATVRPGDEVRCGTLVMRLMPDVSRSSMNRLSAAQAVVPSSMSPPGAPSAFDPTPPRSAAPPPVIAPPPAFIPPTEAALGSTMQPPPLVAAAPDPAVLRQLDDERSRRKAAEAAVLTAEQRATTAESRHIEAEGRVRSLEQRLADADAQAQDAAERARVFELGAKQANELQRRLEQANGEVKRLQSLSAASAEDTNAEGVPSPALLADLTGERDKLRQRVAELETQLAASAQRPAAAPGADDVAKLQRKIDQLTADNRRLRGGQPAPPAADDSRVPELEAKLAQAERERDEARRALADAPSVPSAPAQPDPAPEIDKLKRVIEQLNAENRRLRQGAGAPPAPPAPPEDPRVPELTARLAKVEQERDALKTAAAAAPPAAASPPAGIGDAVAGIDDALADLRGSLRAAQDEVGLLSVEAPSDSVSVLKDSLTAIHEQTEAARGKVREVRTLLKLPS